MADTWHITSTEQHTQLAPTGTGFTDVKVIYYQIDSGNARGYKGSVTIPADIYTADTVRKAVQAAVDTEESVYGL